MPTQKEIKELLKMELDDLAMFLVNYLDNRAVIRTEGGTPFAADKLRRMVWEGLEAFEKRTHTKLKIVDNLKYNI